MNTMQIKQVYTFHLLLVFVLCVPIKTIARQLNIPFVAQDKTEWCWAATSKGVLGYYGVSKTQTELATWVFTAANNTALPLYNSAANTKLGVNKVLSNFAGSAIGAQYYNNGTLSKSDIFTEIDKNCPIPILGQSVWGANPKYHIISIIGYVDNGTTNPIIIFNDPLEAATKQATLTWIQKTTGVWEWQETLRLQKSGTGGTGIFDGVAITSTNFTYTEPIVARTYTGSFIRKNGSYAYATYWKWSISFSHTGGEYEAAFFNGSANPSLTTTWNAPAFTLPPNIWNYSNDGAVIGKLKLSCIDTDGYPHDDTKVVFYIPPNPYPGTVAFAYSSVASPSPDVKAHQAIILQDYQINSGAVITFKAGQSIEIRDNVTIQNGSLSNFIVDPLIR